VLIAFASRATAASKQDSLLDHAMAFARFVVSFEFIYVFYLYSNALKFIVPFPRLPVDETVLAAGMSILIGAMLVMRKGIRIDGMYVAIAYLLFVSYLLFSWSWSLSKMLAPQYLSYYFTFQFWNVIAGCLVMGGSRERVQRFVIWVILFSLFVAISGIIIFHSYGTFRFYGGFEEGVRVYNRWGYATAFGCVAAFAVLCYSRALSWRQLVILPVFFCMFYFLLIASSRGSLLSALAGMLSLLLLVTPRFGGRGGLVLHRSYLLFFAAAVAAVGFVIVSISQNDTFATFDRFAKLYNQSQNTDLVFGPNRFVYFREALNSWYNAPFFGNGIAEFSIYVYGHEVSGGHPHNLILEILSDGGIVGLSLFLLLIGTAARRITWNRLRHDPLLVVVTMMFVSKFVAGMYSTELALMNEMFVCLGLLTVAERRDAATAGLGHQGLAVGGAPPRRSGEDEAAAMRPRHRPSATLDEQSPSKA